MRKIIFSVLMVLLLSLVLLGCGKDPCEVCGEEDCICKSAGASALGSDAIEALGKMSLTANDVLTPLGTTYHDCFYSSVLNSISIYWKDANQSMFDNYEKAWKNRAVSIDGTAFSTVQIDFYGEAGEGTGGIEYPAGTIYFYGKK